MELYINIMEVNGTFHKYMESYGTFHKYNGN